MGGNEVPNVYPVDIFERLWAVDRLQRLGISHHFEAEIEPLVNVLGLFFIVVVVERQPASDDILHLQLSLPTLIGFLGVYVKQPNSE
ncbi:hypothetical protein KSP39_PZI005113 [Platanthera zijinensis]|uniref:Terpene synthase N-terminal domain-containing protein n=1 Tax=Platanthera zijinensis TaxID=2320716 RepID=A0AAP0BUE3_9ASPA